MIPMVREFWEARLLAWKLGSYPNCAMARRTFSFVSSLIEGLFLQVLDTVEEDTPARAATSFMVTAMIKPPGFSKNRLILF